MSTGVPKHRSPATCCGGFSGRLAGTGELVHTCARGTDNLPGAHLMVKSATLGFHERFACGLNYCFFLSLSLFLLGVQWNLVGTPIGPEFLLSDKDYHGAVLLRSL